MIACLSLNTRHPAKKNCIHWCTSLTLRNQTNKHLILISELFMQSAFKCKENQVVELRIQNQVFHEGSCLKEGFYFFTQILIVQWSTNGQKSVIKQSFTPFLISTGYMQVSNLDSFLPNFNKRSTFKCINLVVSKLFALECFSSLSNSEQLETVTVILLHQYEKEKMEKQMLHQSVCDLCLFLSRSMVLCSTHQLIW